MYMYCIHVHVLFHVHVCIMHDQQNTCTIIDAPVSCVTAMYSIQVVPGCEEQLSVMNCLLVARYG